MSFVLQFADTHGVDTFRINALNDFIYLIEVGQCNIKFLGNQEVLPLLLSIIADFLCPDSILRYTCLIKSFSQSLFYL